MLIGFYRSIDPDDSYRLSPERGNVAFASTQMGWCFTLSTFASMYADTFGSFDIDEFAVRLWGNIFFDPKRRKFTRKGADVESKRTFVHFILEPLYKLYSQVSPANSSGQMLIEGGRTGLERRFRDAQGDSWRAENNAETCRLQNGHEATLEGRPGSFLRAVIGSRGHAHRAHTLSRRQCRQQGALSSYWLSNDY